MCQNHCFFLQEPLSHIDPTASMLVVLTSMFPELWTKCQFIWIKNYPVKIKWFYTKKSSRKVLRIFVLSKGHLKLCIRCWIDIDWHFQYANIWLLISASVSEWAEIIEKPKCCMDFIMVNFSFVQKVLPMHHLPWHVQFLWIGL